MDVSPVRPDEYSKALEVWEASVRATALLDHAVTTYGATALDVNEQNAQAVGFYLHYGFEVAGRSELDGTGRAYPLLHLRLVPREVG